MMRSVYLKTLYDKRFFVLGWSLGMAALAALMTSFYPAMHQDGVIDALVQNLPPAFKGLIGDLTNLSSFHTYLAAQLFDIRLPLIAGVMAIILGLSLSVAEEEKGELRTILSLPISRVKLLIHKWLAMVSIMAITLIGLLVGMFITIPLTEGASIGLEVVARLVAMTWLMMIVYGTIPFAIGFSTGRRGIASGLSILVIIGSFLLSTFAQAVDWLKEFEFLSLLHYFPAVDIAKDAISLRDVAVLGGIALVLLVVSVVTFRRRDIA